MKWITAFLEENSERWTKEKLEREKAAKDILAAWSKAAKKARVVWRMKEDIKEDEKKATTDEKSD